MNAETNFDPECAEECDDCHEPVWRDCNGYWVGRSDDSDCPANPKGHHVDGEIR